MSKHPTPLAVAAALVLSVAAVIFYRGSATAPTRQMSLAASIGGPFDLLSYDNRRVSSKNLKGTPFAVFFGFTNCPDICPTTMLSLSNLMKRLGPDADNMRYFFISVDTERDTPEHLKLYLSSFDDRITGLTGTASEIADVARSYRAYYEKVPTSDGYTYNHTAIVYLMGRDGRLIDTISFQEKEDTQFQKLKRLIDGS